MNTAAPTGPRPPVSTVWASSREHSRERLEIHNIEVDVAVAGQHLCGNLHLPTGRVCRLPERHRGGCQFTYRPARQFISAGLATSDGEALPDCTKRFLDRAQYRVETGSVEGPDVLETVLAEADARGVL